MRDSGDSALLRKRLLSQTEHFLRKRGLSISRDYVLLSKKGKAVGWRPSLYAKGAKENLAIEIMPDADIPAYLVNALRLCKSRLRSLQIGLRAVVPRGAVLSESLKKASLEFDIPILEVSATGFREIFSKQIFLQVAKAQPDEIDRFQQERAAGRHIPGVLLDLVKSMRRVKLKRQLQGFARSYEIMDFTQTRFDPLTEEYEFVLKFLTKIATGLFGSREAKRLDVAQKVERMRLQVGDYRDHFIHAFQVFLLGIVIIDTYYVRFKKWMRSQTVDHLEETWFLASIFHDIHKPLEDFEWLGEDEGLEIGVNFVKWKEMIALLAATYGKRKHVRRKARQLQQVLRDHYARIPRNHGILAALDMINSASGMNTKNTPFHVATAAQSVAIHDWRTWEDLTVARIMPLIIEEDPIGYLLIYCDAAQEWGRPGTESADQVGLMGISMGSEVQCTVFFADPEAATPKLYECQSIRRYLKTTSLRCLLFVTVV